MRFAGVEFTDQRIEIDGHEWVGCEFVRCTICFTGLGDTLNLSGCHFDGCNWELNGPAGRTIEMLRALNQMRGPGGRLLVEQVITALRTPSPA